MRSKDFAIFAALSVVPAGVALAQPATQAPKPAAQPRAAVVQPATPQPQTANPAAPGPETKSGSIWNRSAGSVPHQPVRRDGAASLRQTSRLRASTNVTAALEPYHSKFRLPI